MSKVKVKLRGVQQYHRGTVDFENGTVEMAGYQYDENELLFDAPISGTIYGTLLNFKGAYANLETSMHKGPYKEPPKAPVLYIKPKNTIIGNNIPIPLPKEVSELEIGASLGIVIGKTATKVNEEEAMDYVYGYTIVNDVSIPHTSVYRPAVKEKARDGFCPVGPWIVEREAVNNPDDLGIRVFVNNELKQENNTKNLIRPIKELIADITSFMTLFAGDTLLVGVPENAPLAKLDDNVLIEIDRIGTLKNTIKNEEAVLGGAK